MIAICSWCQCDLGPREPLFTSEGKPCDGVYYEVCEKPECQEKARRQQGLFARVTTIEEQVSFVESVPVGVIICEDDSNLRSLLERSCPFKVFAAVARCSEALEVVKKLQGVNVLLVVTIDGNLLGCRGAELCESLRTIRPKGLITISHTGDEELQTWAHAHLSKKYSVDRVWNLAEELVAQAAK